MSESKGRKLHRLQLEIPEGLLVDAAWLERHGYPSNLRNRYVRSGWLEPLARGVFRRPLPHLRPEVEGGLPWTLVVLSLQTLLEWPGVVGGRTALSLEGFDHYLSPHGPSEVHLYGDQPPPRWLGKLGVRERFVFHRDSRLFPAEKRGGGLDAVAVDVASGVSRPVPKGLKGGPPVSLWTATNWPLTCSGPERAILEMLNEVPKRETFHQADVIFQSLSVLNPKACQRLLEASDNIKVKRLFLWFAARHGHAWAKRINRSRIDLGSGKRVIARPGRFNNDFQITVPEDLGGVR